MTFKVTIQPSGHAFEADSQHTVLEAALDAGYLIPYGCRNGACGSCKGKVLQGEVTLRNYQESVLSNQERAQGYTLFCCAKPTCDLVIECREVRTLSDIPVRTLPCRVQKIEKPAADVAILHLKLPTNERLQFLAGQYIDFLLRDGRRRSFSLANAPHDDEFLQIHIRHVPGGRFTEQVFTTMKEKDILRLEGPFGSFYLREESDKPIVFVAGGTGFAPIKAVIEHVIHNKIERPMILYWGARDRSGLYLHELAEHWAATVPQFKYVPVLSDNPSEEPWHGRTGLVHQAVLADLPDLSAYQVYACGAPAMIDAAKRDFGSIAHLPESEFFADSFTYAADTTTTSP